MAAVSGSRVTVRTVSMTSVTAAKQHNVLVQPATSFKGSTVRLNCASRTRNVASKFVVQAGDKDADLIPQKEWPTSYSHCFEDITESLRPLLFLPEAQPEKPVAELMTSGATTVAASTMLSTVNFEKMTGFPVVDDSGACIGVLSKKDTSDKVDATVGDAMSSPAITIAEDRRVADAAALMLKHKVHRLPVVDAHSKAVVGIVTRKDIFTALGQSA
mmetsp:Transcript_41199/g.49967  ORF Transcript_41199/g.49967 Transcript_41199/m.49967 type:complete len:216 (-) Transcript_41199:346-993(-)|eukprot:CAMPEP_0197854992 /NCGR_PEP_ID=MMETSP1438-20131217/25739_1 /TAXON_ID=1461541 /ORGANISM="Pterosperma sp., Strain CCMP1384" /LENGTH=215 /DNA_ID=CAMNT_0043469945 /DNA_START=137 /DNA_END=784 /DNA_ORIENTATION=+